MATWGMSQELPRNVGIARARELSFSGRFFSPAEIHSRGLVNRICSADNLLDEALAVAAEIASNDAATLSGMRGLINDGWQSSRAEGLQLEYQRARPHNDALDYGQMEGRPVQLRKR